MTLEIIYLFIFALFLWYLSFTATRLDRLHHRVETSWAALDGLLQRRAAIALEIAHTDFADPGLCLILTEAAQQAREAEIQIRSEAESGLTTALNLVIENNEQYGYYKDLVRELNDLTDRIRVAIKLHVESVNRTQAIRKKIVVKMFRLAGHAPLPAIYKFEEDVI
mgnify:CR=1 FL=1